MEKIVNTITSLDPIKNLVNKIHNRNGKTTFKISPLYGSSKSFFISRLIEKEKQLVVLLPDTQSVSEFNVELSILGLEKEILAITDFQPETIQEKLTEINKRKKFILLANYELLNCRLPEKEEVEKTTTRIEVGGEISYDDLIEYLNLLNYQRDRFVEAPGEYSIRGAIIDFWSFSEHNPVRLEFDGDFLESIRHFEPESQRSIEKIDSATLAAPLHSENETGSESYTDIFEYLENPLFIASSFELSNLKEDGFNVFTKKDKEEKPVVSKVEAEVNEVEEEFPEVKVTDEPEEDFTSSDESFDIGKLLTKANTTWIIEEEIGGTEKIETGITEAPVINSNFEILFSILKKYSNEKYEVIISSENEIQTGRLTDLLSEFKDELRELIDSGKVKIITLPLKKGFLIDEEKFLLLSDYQTFNKPYRTKTSTKRKYKKSKSKAFESIKRGDFVVHEEYGIGKYAGLESIKIGEAEQETMKLQYNEGGVVYVNLNYLSLVKKYSSSDNITPYLSTLGSADWSNKKRKTKKKIKEAARELIELYAKRKASKGFAFNSDTVWQKELEASFQYEDTPDQTKVTEELKEDMETESPMDRLVCGDVGFGKTEVAVRAAFKAVQDGKQVAVLVPTTILAEQHYNTFVDRLTQFPVTVAVLSRFQTKKEQKEIVENLKLGKLDVVIGTHRLISKDVSFRDLGLLIIDEEHRFGVKVKEKLRTMKVNVDTLTLTATPIPRTLNLSLLGARDLSIIGTPPPNRQSIITHVSTFDILKIKEWIMNELRRNGQVYFVHDRVRSIDKLAGYLHKYIPDIRIAIAHGQMKPSQLEDVIHGFLNKKYDVLLSTKIIESGMDIPNVNTIIVNRADRFGLAELHQLRGRVGRSNRQAFAYFIVPSLSGITKKALRRLQAIEEFTDVGAGFNISMRDLEIRGAGNLLGTEQTGFINDVGFDLYVKMINEAVEELKYQEFQEVFKSLPKQEERTDPTIDTYFDIGIPSEYMQEQMDRLNFYTALYSIKTLQELEELKDEMTDRFGQFPSMVNRLLKAAVLKFYSSYAFFERVAMQRKNIFIILPKGEKEDYYKTQFVEMMRYIMDEYKDEIKFNQQKEVMRLVIPNKFESPDKLLDYLVEFAKNVSHLFGRREIVEEEVTA